MWKVVIGFIVFSAVAIVMLLKGGDIDMSGEKHGIETAPAPVAPATAPAAAPAAPAAAPAAPAAAPRN